MSSACDLVILGAGGMGQEVADIVRAAESDGTRWRLIGFIDDDSALHGLEVLGLPVLGDLRWLSGRRAALAMGWARRRRGAGPGPRHNRPGSSRRRHWSTRRPTSDWGSSWARERWWGPMPP